MLIEGQKVNSSVPLLFCIFLHMISDVTSRQKPLRHRTGSVSVERARRIILRYGRNSTAYQIVNPGFRRWLASEDKGLVGYVQHRKACVAAGEPVCLTTISEEVTASFEQEMLNQKIRRICWFCASAEFAERFHDRSGYSTIYIGAQPVWNPAHWHSIIANRASLRAQLNRAKNKGITVSEWTNQQAAGHPELERCLREWLESRPFPPLHFLVEPQTLYRLYDRRVFVAERQGRAVGFLVLSPIPRRNGWLVEQFVRAHGAPNGTTELMIDHAVRMIANEGYEYVTLGLAPLSQRAGINAVNPPLIRFLLGWIRLHGQRFYNFDGLDFFKAKFAPDYWEPIWAVSNESRFSLRTLYAVAAAFSNGSPLRGIIAALFKALQQEGTWLAERLQSQRD